MSLFFRPRPGAVEQRAVSYQDFWGSGDSPALGAADGILSIVPVYGAIRLIADVLGATPLVAYQRLPDGTSKPMPVQPDLIARPPWGTLAAWKKQPIVSLLCHGNAYGVPTGAGGDGWTSGIVWLHPGDVTCDDTVFGQPPRYWVRGVEVSHREIVHVPWIVPPGRAKGLSPIGAFRVLWETAQSTQKAARDTYVNGGVPSVHVKSTRQITAEGAAINKARYQAAIMDRQPWVTGNDWDVNVLGLPADDARFIEQLKLTATQVASIYGVPPEEIGGETGSSLTYATVESNDLRLSARTMRPFYTAIQDALNMHAPGSDFVKFDADAMVSMDVKTRVQSHAIGIRAGIETIDEARHAEDRPPLTPEQLDLLLQLSRRGGASAGGSMPKEAAQ